ncbi:hypothetical protein ACKKBG_A27750 [Auxenochlorella protothecoides x Auxenochlorella symbiontica]
MATWLDATAFLERGCGALHPEELVHGEDFSLYEAMLAIQIGDTKMDIGLRREQGPSLAEELASGHAPLALSLATLEQLGMQLMQAEATWHLGSMLPTTVFSSLYMLDIPRLVSNPVLHALCLSVQQSCNLVHDLLLNGHVCEDEDISIHTFGMRILGAPGTTALPQACAALRSAVEDLGSDAPGLAAHLSFRLHCLQGLERMLAANADGIDAGVAQLELALGCLEAVSAAASSDAATDTAADGSCGPRSLGFVPGINVRHMGLAPPRALAWVGARPAAAHWRGVLRALCDAARAVRAVRTWPQLRAALVTLAARDSHAIVRSTLYAMLTKPMTAARQAAGSVTTPAPGALPPWCPSWAMAAATLGLRRGNDPCGPVAQFLEQAGVGLAGWVHTACLNRCRQRRRHRRQLADWANLLDHAALAQSSPGYAASRRRDVRRGQPALSPVEWVESEAAGSQLLHLQLGFPLNLYAPAEFVTLYWYCDYLLLARRGRWGSAPEEAVADVDRAACQAMVVLCQGVAAAAGACMRRPPSPFNTAEDVFEQRFGCMRSVARPEALTLGHYRASQAAVEAGAVSAAALLLGAATRFGALVGAAAGLLAGTAVDLAPAQERHLTGLRRIATQNGLAAQLLMKGTAGEAAPTLVPTWDFSVAREHSTCMFFPILGLKRAE